MSSVALDSTTRPVSHPVREQLWSATKPISAALSGEVFAAVVFSLRTFLAALLALFIAFWFTLDEPRWALLTVYVVAQPDSGLVIAKGVFRMLGTIAGALASIALVFGLSQHGVLFLVVLSLWIGFCNFAARAVRNFSSYGFLLAGYTAAIIGIPAALDPNGAYPVILARFTEIALGLACAGLASRVVLPSNLTPKLVARVNALIDRVHRFAASAVGPARDRKLLETARMQLIEDCVAAEAMRSNAFFESPETRLLNRPLRDLIDRARHMIAVALENFADFGSPAHSTPEGLRSSATLISATENTPCGNGAAVSALVHAEARQDFDDALFQLRVSEAAFRRRSEAPGPIASRHLWSDPVLAALMGVRSALAIAVTSSFWMATAWPSGPIAVIFAACACSLFASMEQPVKITLAIAVALLLSVMPVFVTLFYLLPLATDFPSMAVALAPLLLTCGFIIAVPKIGALGLFVVAYFEVVSEINNVMTYDSVGFLNTTVACFLAIGVVLVLFATFFPETPIRVARRFRRQLLMHLSRLARPGHSDIPAFEQALCERLGGALARLEDKPQAVRKCFVCAESALSCGRAIDRLKAAIAAGQPACEIAVEGSSLLRRISWTYVNPTRARCITSAWQARALRRRALAAARATTGTKEVEMLGAVVAASEVLRSRILEASLFMPETADVR